MATVYRLLDVAAQFFDDNGDPYAGGKLFTYVAGSSTKKTTYQDSTGTTPHANPIVLDSGGRLPAPVFGTTGAYKFVLAPSTDTDPPSSAEWTEDGISGINDTATTSIDQWVTSGLTPTYVSATSFTLSGDQTSEFHVGRRLKSTNSGGTRYSRIITSAYGALTTVTVVNDSGTLDAGLSEVSYGLVSFTNTSLPLLPASLGAGLTHLQTITTAAAQTNADLTLDLTNYNEFLILVDNWAPNTAGSGFWLRSSADGVTYRTASYQWVRNNLTTAPANSPLGSASDSKVELASDVGGGIACGTITVRSLSGLGVRCEWDLSCVTNAGLFYRADGAGYSAAGADPYIRLTNSTGTITNGVVVRLYGVKKS
jgi:hypothetical protein